MFFEMMFVILDHNSLLASLSYGNDVKGLKNVEDEERAPAEDEYHHNKGQHPHHLAEKFINIILPSHHQGQHPHHLAEKFINIIVPSPWMSYLL
jgi:hypothetical protein